MPELDLAVPSSSLPQTPPQTSPTTSASPAIMLPQLEAAPDERFLGYNPSLAGRAVVVELLASPKDSREARQGLWEAYRREGGNIQELGLAAQALERTRFNWRQAKKPAEILEAYRSLPQGSIN